MKSIIAFCTGAALAGIISFFFMSNRAHDTGSSHSAIALRDAQMAVEKKLQETSIGISSRLQAFCAEIARDQTFSLKLFVENNASAPEVSDIAVKFLKPMGCSLLEVTDSAYTILSSGHFPASIGNSEKEKAEFLTSVPTVLLDNLMTGKVLTLQAKCRFSIAGDIPFYAMGGMVIDTSFLSFLSPRQGVRVLLKRGNDILGMNGISTISEIKNSRISINDKSYSAAYVEIPCSATTEKTVLIVLLEKPIS